MLVVLVDHIILVLQDQIQYLIQLYQTVVVMVPLVHRQLAQEVLLVGELVLLEAQVIHLQLLLHKVTMEEQALAPHQTTMLEVVEEELVKLALKQHQVAVKEETEQQRLFQVLP